MATNCPNRNANKLAIKMNEEMMADEHEREKTGQKKKREQEKEKDIDNKKRSRHHHLSSLPQTQDNVIQHAAQQ